MTDQQTTTPARRPWTETLGRNARPAGVVLIVLALALAALAIWMYFKYAAAPAAATPDKTAPALSGSSIAPLSARQWPIAPYIGCVAVALLVGGIWLLVFEPGREDAAESVRLF